VSPVLSPAEAADHPHAQARQSFRNAFDVPHPAPAPRFSRSEAAPFTSPPRIGDHSRQVLNELGFLAGEIEALLASGAVRQLP
jgi:alpha-methylacyl-CoA racemase